MAVTARESMIPLRLDLRTSPLLAPLPRAFLRGESRGLLAPLRLHLLPAALDALRPVSASPRSAVAAALEASNRALGHPRASELSERLADPEAAVVVTGQQPGLFGGPLYTLSKAVAAAKAVQALEASGRPAVAVFWIATEDHDFEEVASATLGPVPRRVSLGPDLQALAPVGPRRLGDGVTRLLAELCPDGSPEPYASWVRVLATLYRPDVPLGEAFARLLLRLLGERAPLLLDAMDPALKRLERPLLQRLVERRRRVAEAIAEASDRVEAAGFHPQVRTRPGASPLFLLREGERRCVEWREGDGFRLRGSSQGSAPIDELLARLAGDGAELSPGVLARPAIQDGLLGTSLQLLGPGELAYMAQAAALYPVLEVTPPAVTLRPQLLVIDARERDRLDQLARLGLQLEHLLGEPAALERRLASCLGTDFVRPLAEEIDGLLERLRAPARELEVQLEGPLEKTREQVSRALDRFAAKAAGAAARRDETLSRRLERLRQSLLPGGVLQERVIASAHYPGRFGDRFVDTLFDRLELDSACLQVITIDEPAADSGSGPA